MKETFIFQAIVRFPAIRYDGCTILYVTLDRCEKSILRPILNHMEEALFRSFNASKQSCSFHSFASAVLPFTEYAPVYFCNHIRTSKHRAFVHTHFHAYFSTKTHHPNHDCFLCNIYFKSNEVTVGLSHPHIRQFKNFSHTQFTLLKPAVLPNRYLHAMSIRSSLPAFLNIPVT
ncbi:hypothetical protein TNCV_468201 [Trichonephila clavipes]|nr:hypothetical protein TNCV_468201 [Trichonephila clavipes]